MDGISLFFAEHPFVTFAALMTIVVVISAVMKLLKQPLLIGYIIAGIVLGPSVLGLLHDHEYYAMFSQIGIALLLFLVGLGLNPLVVKELGRASLFVGLGQVIFTSIFGYALAWGLGYDVMTSIYIAVALAFSSTIIIVKLLSDTGSLNELYGKISIGMLIVQDIIAMLLLMLLSSLPSAGEIFSWSSFLIVVLGKMIAVVGVAFILARFVLPRCLNKVAQSGEFLFLFSLAWCVAWAASMELIGFSLEIGALIAGLCLASLPYRFEIANKMKSLRDFFIMVFFVFLGSQLVFTDISNLRFALLVFSLFVLLGNPFIVMVIMGLMGYRKKTSLMVGFTVAQISEFSFILMALGLSLGHIRDPQVVSLITLVGLITIAGSSYYFNFSDLLYQKSKGWLSLFERKILKNSSELHTEKPYEVIVFGNHRTGKGIVQMLQNNKKEFFIMDHDPEVIKELQSQQIPCIYADASDIDVLEDIDFTHAKMFVSTIHEFSINKLIIEYIHKTGREEKILIMSARDTDDAKKLYELGVHYVIVPHLVSGSHTAMLIESFEYDPLKYRSFASSLE